MKCAKMQPQAQCVPLKVYKPFTNYYFSQTLNVLTGTAKFFGFVSYWKN